MLSQAEVQEIRVDAGDEFDDDLMTALDVMQDAFRISEDYPSYNYVAEWFTHYVLCVRGDEKRGTTDADDYLKRLREDFISLKLKEAQ